MLEAFQSLREELTTKKQAEVDQTSASASKPGPSSSAVVLDLPPPRPKTTSQTEDMDVNYGPALSDQDLPQHDPDPPYYKEVALSDIPSQYAEEVDTFRCLLSLPDPRESMPRSSTFVMGLDDEP